MICVRCGALWLLFAACSLIACRSESIPAPDVGSDTNWLRSCTQDADCSMGECRCGVCTMPCRELDACAGIADAQLCIEVGELSAASCRLGFPDPAHEGICSWTCADDRDCGPEGGTATHCLDGICLPSNGSTPNGSVADLAGMRERDAGQGSADGGFVDPGDGRIGGAPDVPVPQPQCPCVSDLAPGAAPPAPGDAEPNAYGNPSPPAEPSDSPLSGGVSFLQCALPAPLWWFVVETECIRYGNCMTPCTSDTDCPSGGSGSAASRCATTGACFLDCSGEKTCPDGMACVTGSDGAACFWPQAVLAPGCDGYCRQHPRPRDCDNWCAEALVACHPDAGINCCQGLTCTEGGFCDELP